MGVYFYRVAHDVVDDLFHANQVTLDLHTGWVRDLQTADHSGARRHTATARSNQVCEVQRPLRSSAIFPVTTPAHIQKVIHKAGQVLDLSADDGPGARSVADSRP